MSNWFTANAPALLSFAGTAIGAGAVYVSSRITGRQAAKAHSVQAEAQAIKADATAYDTGREIWGDLIDDLRNQVRDQRDQIAAMRRDFDEEMKSLRDRLCDLEQKRAGDRRAIHLLSEYARTLLRTLKQAGIEPPQPPEGLDVEIDS